MTDTNEIQRPTRERESKADHVADDGKPTQEKPFVRAMRLGTAWDRYCRDRDKDGKLLADEDMILTRRQIATGNDYIEAVHAGLWGGAVGSKMEPRVASGFKGPPAAAIDAGKKAAEMENRLNPRYLVSLAQAVLLEGFSAETWATATGRKVNSGIHYLRIALDQMCGD